MQIKHTERLAENLTNMVKACEEFERAYDQPLFVNLRREAIEALSDFDAWRETMLLRVSNEDC